MCVLDGSATLQDWMVWDKHPIRKQYDVVMDLGEGAFSQVVLARHKETKKLAALKVVYLQNPELDAEHLGIMKREAEYLNMLDSPRLVECLDVVDNGVQQVIVLEYLRGGQLYDALHRLGGSEEPYTEQAAATIFSQMAEAVAFMHDYGILHRDIKGENFVFMEDPAHAAKHRREPRVKLIDLGMATLYDPKNPVYGALGSPGFVSPEVVHDKPHSPAMDIFSLGVVAFVMLVGRKPFSIQDSENLKYCDMDIKDAPGLQDPRWAALSAGAKDLLMGMLRYKPQNRLTAHQVVEHDWVVTRGGAKRRPLDAQVAKGAANVAALRRLRNMAHGVVSQRRVAAALEPSDARKRAAANFSKSRNMQDRSRGYRNDPSGRGISRLERMTIKATAANVAKAHDRGETVEPEEDISVHYRANRGYGSASTHGGRAFYNGGGSRGSSGNDLHQRSLKHVGSAVMLSEMEAEGSYHGGLLHPSQSVMNLDRAGSAGRPLSRSSMLAALGSSIRNFADRSSHGSGNFEGSRHSSGDSHREDRSRSGRWTMRRSSSRLEGSLHGSRHGSKHGASGFPLGAKASTSKDAPAGSGMARSHSGSLHGTSGSFPGSRNSSVHGGMPTGDGSNRGARGLPDLPITPSQFRPGRVHRVSPLMEGRESIDLAPSPTKPAPFTAMQLDERRRSLQQSRSSAEE